MKNTNRVAVLPVAAFLIAYTLVFNFLSDFERNNFSTAGPASQLIFDFVDEAVEIELQCDYYKQCLHIEVIDSAQCPESILIRMGYRDTRDRFIHNDDVIVPSPKFTGGFVIEVGSNLRAEIGQFGVVRLNCSKSAPNISAAS